MGKNLLKDFNLKKPIGDIIDQVSEEQEQLKKQKRISKVNVTTISNYYHKRLYDNPDAIEYLKGKGIIYPEIYARFKIGYADSTLQSKISPRQAVSLKGLGLICEGGADQLQGSVTFPLFNEADKIVGLTGINITDGETQRIIPGGSERGLFNHKACRVYDKIILTSSIFDALSFIQAGFDNVQAFSNADGFILEHLPTLKAHRVTVVTLAFNGDETSQKAIDIVKDILLAEDISVRVLSLPDKHTSWPEAIQNDLDKPQIKTMIKETPVITPAKDSIYFTVKREGVKQLFSIDDVTYTIQGVKEGFVSNLRVNIRAAYGDDKHIDNIDLYSARSRASFSNTLAALFNIEAKKIEKDLIKILEYLEAERDKQLNNYDNDKLHELTEYEQQLGLKFLESKDLFNDIIADLSTLGYVGEDLNKLLIYLCASSRKLDDPINAMIVSQSASGKSMLVDTVKRLIPAEDVISITTLSDQALNYIGDLMHKFLVFGEAVHSDTIEHQIREMLSSKELTRLVTDKDEKTGKMQSNIKRTKAIVSTVMSTTNHRINPENASRYFLINTDESREQTRRIHDAQRNKYSLDRYMQKRDSIPQIIEKHHAAQRMLKKYVIINPFAKHLDFPDVTMRTRRDNDRFLDLIACVCFLRQYQKKPKTAQGIEYIECDLKDYRIAYDIMVNAVLGSTLNDLPAGAINLYDEVRAVVKDLAKQKDLKPEDISVTQRDLREKTGFNHMFIKRYIRVLVDYELIKNTGGRQGSRKTYSLVRDEGIMAIDNNVIPSPADMQKAIKQQPT